MSELKTILDVFAAGDPKGEPRSRARAIKVHGKYIASMYPDSSADGWRQLVCCALVGHVPRPALDGPATLMLHFTFPRPKRLLGIDSPRHEIPHTAKPDADNLAKLVCDQMTKMAVWADDAQVTDVLIRKRYCAIGAEPGVRIVLMAGVSNDVQAALFTEATP